MDWKLEEVFTVEDIGGRDGGRSGQKWALNVER